MAGFVDYLRTARELESRWVADGAPARRLAVLASFTADFVRPFLLVECDRAGAPLVPWVAPFGQLEQVVLDPRSPFHAGPVAATWITLRIEDIDPSLVDDFAELGPERARERLTALRVRTIELAKVVRSKTSGPILVSNVATPALVDVFDANNPDGLGHLVAAENRTLARELAALTDAHVFDWEGVIRACGAGTWSDPKLWYLARLPIAAPHQPLLARHVARCVRACLRPSAKCIVVDLDDTLWGGILGDDGPEALRLGDDYPGRAFKDFQRALLQLKRRGFLLAICSKNDPDAVRHALAGHPEMILRPADFAAVVASWRPKPENLRVIAESLNIGIDSLVFVDDNPVERAAVRAALPTVDVVELPKEPTHYVDALRDTISLDRPRVLAEDRARSQMYAEEAARRDLRASAQSLHEFLLGLEMVGEVGRCSPLTLERVHQLIQKTNQFNLTTRRHSQEEVRRLGESPDAGVAWLRLRDRFGDMGLVCAGIVVARSGREWEIDTFLMSCRVMGRGVEDAFLAFLAELARGGGAGILRGVYRPTPKNGIVESFYAERGFRLGEGPSEQSTYTIEADSPRLAWPSSIQRRAEERPG